MIVLADTHESICRLSLVDGGKQFDDEWDVGRELADKLLGHLEQLLADHNFELKDITGIGVFEGPGSFTGLRIGMTVFNTLADSLGVPIVGARGEAWQSEVLRKLENGEDQKLVMPFYGSEANITKPRK